MKSLSIKARVAFWYAFSMLIVTALIFALLLIAGSTTAREDARESLIIATDMAVNNVKISKGRVVIDDDFVYYMDHTWIVVSRDDGLILSGLMPEGFPDDVPYEEGSIRQTGKGDNAFLVYDRLIENQKVGKIWVRGMTPIDLAVRDPAFYRIIHLFMVVLPILICLSLAGGLLITRRAFLPLRRINETVATIQEGDDLSKRVSPDNTAPGDEIHDTAVAFDRMLDRIEEIFEKEKQFTNDASHELRTPTAVIRAECEYLMENVDKPEEVMESARVIHAQSMKMSALIDQLLTLARADRFAIKPNLQKTDISLLAEEAAFALAKPASDKGIRIHVDAPEGIYVDVDPYLMSRVLENLVSNGVKYGKEGGNLWITVTPFADTDGKTLKISVKDDGIGIEEKDIDKIWERFYRVESTGRIQGLGLGLPLAKAIVTAHGGTITVESEFGRFTEFTILLQG